MNSVCSAQELEKLYATLRKYGVCISFKDPPSDSFGRYIAIFEGVNLVLFPHSNLDLLAWNAAHVFGHMQQLLMPTDAMMRSAKLIYHALSSLDGRPTPDWKPHTLTEEEVQTVFDYEYEAAMIGGRLLREIGFSGQQLQRYSRWFFADSRYLIQFIETGLCGSDVFEQMLRVTPLPHQLIPPNHQRLVPVSEDRLRGFGFRIAIL